MTAVDVDFVEVLEVFAEAQALAKTPLAAFASGLNLHSAAVGIVGLREWQALNPEKYREAHRACDKRRSRRRGYREARRVIRARYWAKHKDAINAARRKAA